MNVYLAKLTKVRKSSKRNQFFLINVVIKSDSFVTIIRKSSINRTKSLNIVKKSLDTNSRLYVN